jgi:ABC-type lipoprotein release transport system permease subunit
MIEIMLGRNLVKPNYARFLTIGTILGIAAVIVVQSLFANYYRAVEQHLLGLHPHLAVTKESISPAEVEKWSLALGRHDGIVAAAPAIDLVTNAVVSEVETHPVVCADGAGGPACFDFMKAAAGAALTPRQAMGYEIERTRVANVRLRGLVVDGSVPLHSVRRLMDVRTSADELRRLALGPAEGMPMACLFDRTFFHGAQALDDFLVRLPATHRDGDEGRLFRLVSTLNLGMQRSEHPNFITSLESARQLLGRPGFANVFEIYVRDPHEAPGLAQDLAPTLGGDVEITTWIDRDAGSFRLLDVLRTVIFIILFSVVVIAALGIVSTLSLVVMENRPTIAILRAMGLRDRNLYVALILKCWQIAAVGLLCGTVLGFAASSLLLQVPGFRQGLAKMGVPAPEVLVDPGGLAVLVVATLLLYLAVALVPARDACRIDPVEGLHA